jgi:tungstate transport system ATP-binding protein
MAEPHDGRPLLRASDLAFEAGGRRLVDGVGFALGAGERLVVLGPNGAGKSLILRLCHGLIPPSAGAVRWVDEATRFAQAMVFQQPVMLRRSALANVAYPLVARGVPGREASARASAALARVGLAALAARSARVLSGGEQQRVALARAIVTEPRVLWLDEPTSNLDPAATRAIESGVTDLSARGCAVVMATHDLAQAKRLATRVLFLHCGRVQEDTESVEFFARPRSEAAARFLAGEILD